MMSFITIFLIGIGGVVASSFAATAFIGKENQPQPEFTTRFFAINESEIVSGKPAYYRIIVENQEGAYMDYVLKVFFSGEQIYKQEIKLNNSQMFNKTIKLNLNFTDYQILEFSLYKDDQIYRTWVIQVSPVINYSNASSLKVSPHSLQNGDSPETKNETIKREDLPYIKKKNGNAIDFNFYSGENLELNVSNGNVNNGSATYTTVSKGNNITFLEENYEKVQPNFVELLYPITEDIKDLKLKTRETFQLKDGYAVTLNQIDNQTLKLNISWNNRTIREIISKNSTVEYWKEIDDFHKEKVIQITPKKISQNEIILDIIQYGDTKLIRVGDQYGEFQVSNITENSIIMKNTKNIKIETGNETSLMSGKIKIWV